MSFQSTRGHHLRSALDTVQCFFPKIFRSYHRSRSLARIAALPTEAFLAQADSYDKLAQCYDVEPSGNPPRRPVPRPRRQMALPRPIPPDRTRSRCGMSDEYRSVVKKMGECLHDQTPETRALSLITFLAASAYARASDLPDALRFIDDLADAAKCSLALDWARVDRIRQAADCAGEA